jgi:NADH dehydrogenase
MGVEVSGALADLLHTEIKQDYPNLPVDSAQVLLYEGTPHLLGPFKPELQNYALKALEERGVKVHTGTLGSSAENQSNRPFSRCGAGAWWANSCRSRSSGERPSGRFAIGDIATMIDGRTGKPLPGLGATALQAGYRVGEMIKRLVEGKKPESFKYPHLTQWPGAKDKNLCRLGLDFAHQATR